MSIRVSLIVALMLAPNLSHAGVLKCKISGYNEDIFITTPPDTNSNDGQYARIGVSPGIGNRALTVGDRMGAIAFVELNVDGTPVGLLTVQKNLQVIKSSHSIDPFGLVSAPSQNTGVCTPCAGVRTCLQ
ncbi:hypothetical protein ABID65_005373 [Bradyrhizobium sp. S3.9.2]|uniref:hypothetical protein n=1 Tax=Bradyrhizobium sp. S3.9.2 TaxID=3156432 RepID=UPI00339B3C49